MRTNEILSEAVPAKKPLVPHIELETELQKQLTKQRKDLSQKEKQISFYKQSLSNNKQQLTKAQKRLDTLSADPAADQQKIKNLTDTIKYLTPYVNSDLKIINKLTKEVEKLKKSIPKLEQQVQQQQATQKSPIDPKMVNRLVKQIQTNCGWYLDLMKAQNKWLYRGRSKGRGIG
jgi:chromosome segregation ATPase